MTDADFKAAGYLWHADNGLKGEPCTGCWQRTIASDGGRTALFTLTAFKWDWPKLNSRGAPDSVEYEWEMWLRPRNDRWCAKVTIGWCRDMTVAEVAGLALAFWHGLEGQLDLRPAKEDDE